MLLAVSRFSKCIHPKIWAKRYDSRLEGVKSVDARGEERVVKTFYK